MKPLTTFPRIVYIGLLFLSLCSTPAVAAIARIGAANATCAGTTCPVTYAPTANNLVLVAVNCQELGCISSVTDDAGGGSSTYTAAINANTLGNSVALFYVPQVKAGVTTITANFAFNRQGDVIVVEYSGAHATAPFDQVSTQATASSGTTQTSNSVTTTQANEVLIGLVLQDSSVAATFTAGAGYSNMVNDLNVPAGNTLGIENQIVSATGTYTATTTSSFSCQWYIYIATFKAAASARNRIFTQ